ncbi:hypothetical protein CORC01_02772 [Colletotrichum orchidophilum]|uniref:2EXR domain-containing protein n=1 Tax=Colletotrichum orchidophilum TaxID=1209926 RepID=A0A1G4BKE9_9PEZI|nr:uncharacterized protein CORC01_02772 [Colletotrichum orchidophilum]OHF01894.1 hypothetical protein CORC01_02772 [Colletotrichum orchidophilum]
MDLPVRSTSHQPPPPSPPLKAENEHDAEVFEAEHQDGGLRTTDIRAPPVVRKIPPTPWRKLEACKGFDLRTWTAASGSEPTTTTSIPNSISCSSHGYDEGSVFHGFPDLPYELRHKIWRMHLERPRIVVIRGVMDGSGVQASGNDLGNVVCNANWYCENRSPSLFRVCAESRREARSFFRIRLPMRSSAPDSHGFPNLNQRNPVWDQIYINPDWDLVLYQGATRSLTMAILASDLLAYDPLGKGIAHYGSNDWPQSIWHVNPDPGCGMATLNESFAFLKSFVLCTRSTSEITRPLGEGYVYAVAGDVGPAGMCDSGSYTFDWYRASSGMAAKTPNNSMVRKALIFGKGVHHSVVNSLIAIEMTSRIHDGPLSQNLNATTEGWVIKLAWQPPDCAISHVMHLTTGPIREPKVS